MDPVSKAQGAANSETTGRKKVFGRPFQKGQSGNPKGRPKKLEITKIYEKVLRKSQNRKQIEEDVMAMLSSKRMMSVLLLREMAERTEGKVADVVDMNVSGTLSLEQVLEARKKAKK
jgi:hypothetical protein